MEFFQASCHSHTYLFVGEWVDSLLFSPNLIQGGLTMLPGLYISSVVAVVAPFQGNPNPSSSHQYIVCSTTAVVFIALQAAFFLYGCAVAVVDLCFFICAAAVIDPAILVVHAVASSLSLCMN
jgi:hypothetical protein